jgi:hypothetical protein
MLIVLLINTNNYNIFLLQGIEQNEYRLTSARLQQFRVDMSPSENRLLNAGKSLFASYIKFISFHLTSFVLLFTYHSTFLFTFFFFYLFKLIDLPKESSKLTQESQFLLSGLLHPHHYIFTAEWGQE